MNAEAKKAKELVDLYQDCKGQQDVFMQYLRDAYIKGYLQWKTEHENL